MQTTSGHLLGGRLRYDQPEDGYRTGIEPVLLAAAIPARPGERVLEAGTGAGAGLMCLAARVPGITGVGVEFDPAMADLARRNIAANHLDRNRPDRGQGDRRLSGIEILTGDIRTLILDGFDHAFANPPWHDPRSTPSPLEGRRRAKQAERGEVDAWIAALSRAVRPGGTLTLILPAEAAARLGAPFAPLLPKPGRTAKLAIVRVRGASSFGPPIILHQADGQFTPEIEAVLREGARMPL